MLMQPKMHLRVSTSGMGLTINISMADQKEFIRFGIVEFSITPNIKYNGFYYQMFDFGSNSTILTVSDLMVSLR